MTNSEEQKGLGTLYGVGVGPGDPELLTLKAARVLQSVPVIFTPKADGVCSSTALEIVKEIVDMDRQKVEFASFPIGMGKPSDEVWDNAVEGIVKHLRAGSDVAFLTEGDTMLYGSFSYVSDRMKIRHPEITVEIIPGVTSVTAAAARAQVPLVSHGERLAIWPGMYGVDDLKKALDDYDTIVIMKVNSKVLETVSGLYREGILGRAVLVKRATTDREEIVYDLSSVSPDEAEYFSLLVIHRKAL